MNKPRTRPVRLFLDANVLISAAWKEDSKVGRIWRIQHVELITSDYVLAECWRNLRPGEQTERLHRLLLSVRVLEFSNTPALADPPELPEKDQPVLAAAIFSRADYLVTGDKNHFGKWYGTRILGMRIEPPGSFPTILEDNDA